jgi:nitrite reductase/ring-hydroxylating ferredoxin subunit/uncharacterized membrane protein
MVVSAQTEVENLLVRSPWLDQQVDQIGQNIQDFLRGYISSQGETGIRLRNILNGVWLGHPLHAAATDLPIGAWTGGLIFDFLGAVTGARSLKKAGDWSMAIGVIGGVVAAFAGLADYSEIENEQRRVGTVHGILNALGLTFMGWSLARRLAGDRVSAIPLSTIGYALSFISADIGGLLVYRYGTTVNRQAWAGGPTDFVSICPSNALLEGQLRTAKVSGIEVLLTRVNGQTFAIGNTCTHWGCSLAAGHLEGRAIQCHCHGSTFDLASGSVLRGPATSPEPTFEIRERDGQIEVRKLPY